MAKVFNRKRNFIDASNAIHLITVVNLLNEFEGNASLTGIDLQHSCIGSEGTKHIARGISVGAALTECNMRGNYFDTDSATVLAKVGTEKQIMLFGIKHDQVEANFARQFLTTADAILIGSDLSVSASLTSINLQNNSITDKGAQHIANGISVSTSLTQINLTNNNINSEGAKHIARGICVSKALTRIDLSGNWICVQGAKHLAKGIAVSPSLTQVLTLCSSTPALAHRRSPSWCFAQINLFDNYIGGYYDEGEKRLVYTPEGPIAIVDALRVSTSMTRIDLSRNMLDYEAAKYIFKYIDTVNVARNFNQNTISLNTNKFLFTIRCISLTLRWCCSHADVLCPHSDVAA